jgi:hypothetical protein
MTKVPALIPTRGGRHKQRGVVLLGVELRDAREEMFVIMVCDGLPLRLAYKRAGFESKDNNAPSKLFSLPRVQERANRILEARRTTGVVTLSEVTSMLQRVFAGAQSAEEYSAAHNAAFSLARLYGHVTDKATLEVIRRPSRDPDAPSEQVLSDWVASLPVVSPTVDPAQALPGPAVEGSEGPSRGVPAAPLGPEPLPVDSSADRSAQVAQGPEPQGSGPELYAYNSSPQGPSVVSRETTPPGSGPEGPGPQSDLFNDVNGLGVTRGMEIGNGAPTRPVTGSPSARARTTPLEPHAGTRSPLLENGSPFADQGTTTPTGGDYPAKRERSPAEGGTVFPNAEQLF